MRKIEKSWLEAELSNKNPSEIAKEQGTSPSRISYYIKKYNLAKKKKIHHSSEWLYKKYIKENKSMRELADIAGCSADNISLLLKKHNIIKSNDQVVVTRRLTMNQRYDGPTSLESDILKDKINKTKMDKYGTINTSSILSVKSKLPKFKDIFGRPANEWAIEFGVPRTSILKWFSNNGSTKKKKDFIKYLNEYTEKLSDIENIYSQATGHAFYNKHFDKLDYPDLKYKPDFKLNKSIAINIDGLYWHSTPNKEKWYHFRMRKAYEDLGLRIFQFRGDEINFKLNIVNSIIKNAGGGITKKIYGRKTCIRRVKSSDALIFLKNNHLMGYTSAKHDGLFFDDNLVSIISYKEYSDSIKIERFCSKVDTVVIGALSKLLKNLEGKTDKKYIDYWVDLRYGTGLGVRNLGFEHVKDTLGWKWTDRVNTYNRLRCRANMDKRGLSEKEYAKELKWHKIYDAGQRHFRREIS